MIDIIPAIDIIEGKCVRLTKGDYSSQKIYNENPLEVALQFEAAGLRRLHVVDLDGAKAKHIVNWKVLEKISSKTKLEIDFGGGIQSDADVKIVFECGASQIVGGSIAVKNKNLFLKWKDKFGSGKVILGADVREEKVAISGWTESTTADVHDFVKEYLKEGIKFFICTDIEKDGMLEGSSIDLYRKLISGNPGISLIASGGVSNMDDIYALAETGCSGVIIGKAIYENKIKLSELSKLV